MPIFTSVQYCTADYSQGKKKTEGIKFSKIQDEKKNLICYIDDMISYLEKI